MATNLSNDISWLLEIDEANMDLLGPIRHWQHLLMTVSGGVVWVRGLRPEDIGGKVMRSIPFARVLYLRDEYLYPADGLVPLKKLPPGLSWRPLSKGLPLRFPSFNHNYFGIGERLAIRLVAADVEEQATALLVSMEVLRSYAINASAVRLRPLHWVVLGSAALVVGTPMLPLPGRGYWQQGDHLLPVGYRFEFPILAEPIGRRFCSQTGDRLFWTEDGACVMLGYEDLVALSAGSIRMTDAAVPGANSSLIR